MCGYVYTRSGAEVIYIGEWHLLSVRERWANAQASKPVGSSIDDESRNRAGFSSFLFFILFRHFFLATEKSLSLESQPTDGRQTCFPNDERAIFTMPLITDAKKKRRKQKREAISWPSQTQLCVFKCRDAFALSQQTDFCFVLPLR